MSTRGVSEAAASRPVLDELLAAATAGDIDVVLVAKLDRLGRSLLAPVRALMRRVVSSRLADYVRHLERLTLP